MLHRTWKSFKQFSKRIIFALPSPLTLWTLDVVCLVRFQSSREIRRTQRMLLRKLSDPKTVLAGPFAGMHYLNRTNCSRLLPKLIGTYEMELQPAIQMISDKQCDLLVDIGSAEGFYAVGIATRNPNLKIVCYDIFKAAHYLLRKLAKMNKVMHRIDQRLACTPEELERTLAKAQRPAVICDCEGAEDFLLLPDQTPSLARSFIIVELHPCLCEGVIERVRSRFEPTHQIEWIKAWPRTIDLLPESVKLEPHDALLAMDENRVGADHWFVMVPHNQDQH